MSFLAWELTCFCAYLLAHLPELAGSMVAWLLARELVKVGPDPIFGRNLPFKKDRLAGDKGQRRLDADVQ